MYNTFQMKIFLQKHPKATRELIQEYVLAVEGGSHIIENDIDTFEELFEEFDYFLSIRNNPHAQDLLK